MKLLIVIATLLLLSCHQTKNDGPILAASDYVPAPATPAPGEGASLPSLEEFVLRVMDVCAAKLSPVRKAVLATSISSVAERYIQQREDQETYVILICIESKFDNRARSPVGATGLAQIMPKYAQNFADLCSMGKLENGDIEDPIINLSLGACLYQHLTKELGSSILAIAAYNAGPNSSSVRNLANLANPVPETASYVAKSAMLKEKLKDGKDNPGTVPDGSGEKGADRRDDGQERRDPPVPSEQPTK